MFAELLFVTDKGRAALLVTVEKHRDGGSCCKFGILLPRDSMNVSLMTWGHEQLRLEPVSCQLRGQTHHTHTTNTFYIHSEYTNCISVVTVTSWLEQYSCRKSKGVALKLERKTQALTNKQMSPNVWTLNTQTGNLHDGERLHKMWNFWVLPAPPTFSNDVNITCSLDRWSEVMPESRRCFVWGQTGHDQTALPRSSWTDTLLFGSRVEQRMEPLSSLTGCTAKKEWAEALFSLDWEGHRWYKTDKSSYQDTFLFFSVLFPLCENICTCANTQGDGKICVTRSALIGNLQEHQAETSGW